MKPQILDVTAVYELLKDDRFTSEQIIDFTKIDSQSLQSVRSGKTNLRELTVGQLKTLQNFIIHKGVFYKIKERLVINLNMIKSVFDDERLNRPVWEETPLNTERVKQYRKKELAFDNFTGNELIDTFLFLRSHPNVATKDNTRDFGLYFEFMTDALEFDLGLDDTILVEVNRGLASDYVLPGVTKRDGIKYTQMTVDKFINLMHDNILPYSISAKELDKI